MKVANKEMSVRKLWTSNELLDAVSARKAVSIGKLRGEALRAALSEMRDPELMAFLSNVDVSRVANYLFHYTEIWRGLQWKVGQSVKGCRLSGLSTVKAAARPSVFLLPILPY